MTEKPIITFGTQIRHEDGKLWATFNRDIYRGEPITPDQLDFVDPDDPARHAKQGDEMPPVMIHWLKQKLYWPY